MIAVPFRPGELIISCQAGPDSPFQGPDGMARMARAAELGGAAGIRANGDLDIAAIVAAVSLPVIGISKTGDPNGVYITPTFAAAAAVVAAGAQLVALDGTDRVRPGDEKLGAIIERIHTELDVAVMADVDTFEAGCRAARDGADLIATTLSGYTAATAQVRAGPDLDLVAALVDALDCPIVAEGRYTARGEVEQAFAAGATAVVVGTAVTNPTAITRRLAGRA